MFCSICVVDAAELGSQVTPAAPRHTQPHTYMNTYTNYRIETMKKIIAIVECIPEGYALRNEAVTGIEMNGDHEIVRIKFPAMSMRRIWLPAIGIYGWIVEDWDTVFLEK